MERGEWSVELLVGYNYLDHSTHLETASGARNRLTIQIGHFKPCGSPLGPVALETGDYTPVASEMHRMK